MTSRSQRIAVSGLGCVLAGGCGTDRLASTLEGGVAPTRRLDDPRGYRRPHGASTAVTAGGVDLSDWLDPMAARRMGRPSRMAVAAMKMALEEAGLTAPDAAARVGVAMATTYGPADFSEQILLQILQEGPQAVSPFLFTESVANAPAAQMAIHAGATAANLTVTQREAGPLIALALAAREILRGRADRMLVGAVDEMNALLHAVLDRFGALAGPDDDGVERARPFDRDRGGYLAGEGATVLVLESEEAVRRRGGRVLARLGGVVSAFDPSAPAAGWGEEAQALAAAAADGMERHEIAASAFDAIVSCACGSRRLDRLEGDVLRHIWRQGSLPPVLAPKAVTGEVGAALLAAPILLLNGRWSRGCATFRTVDPEIGITPAADLGAGAVGRVFISALAAGGAAAWTWMEAAA